MPSIAVSSYGVLLRIGDGGGSEAFTTIAEVLDLSGPNFALATEEVTAHDGTGWREFIGTLLEGGEITFDVNYNNAATQGLSGGLYYTMVNKIRRNFQLVIPTTVTKTLSFTALVTAFPFDLPVEGVTRVNITLLITGQPSWA